MGQGSVRFSPGLLIWLSLLILLLPLRWVIAWVLAAGVHELGHLAMLKILRADIGSVQVDVRGARIHTGYLLPWQELLCSLAGPLTGGLLFLLAPWFPRLALCGGFQTLYNLLPVYPLDGGRALHSFAQLLLPEDWAYRVCVCLEALCLAGILWLGIYGAVSLRLGILPLLLSLIVVIRSVQVKIPCKEGKQAVQ